MIQATASVFLNDFIKRSDKSINRTDVIKVATADSSFFYYTHKSNINNILRSFIGEKQTLHSKTSKEKQTAIITHIDGVELTEAEQVLLRVRNKFNFFESMNDQEVLTVAQDIKMLRCDGEEVLFKEGDKGEEVYFIVKGSVSVQINRARGGRLQVAKLGEGEMFGEMAPLTRGERSATVVCIEKHTTFLTFKLSNDDKESDSIAHKKLYHNFTLILAEKIAKQNKLLVGGI